MQPAICKVVADVEEKTRMILSREGINVLNHQVNHQSLMTATRRLEIMNSVRFFFNIQL